MRISPRPFSPVLAAALIAGTLSACGAEAPAPGDVAKPLAAPTTTAEPAPALTVSGEVGRIAGTLARPFGNSTVAVFDFLDLQGQATQLGTYISENLTTELVRAGTGRVLERKQVLQVLEELNLRKADLTTSEVEMAAQQLGAEIVVVGSAAAVGSNVEVTARAVRVSGGSVISADRFSAAAPEAILVLAGRSVPSRGGPGGPAAGTTAGPHGSVTEATAGPVQATLDECRAAGSTVHCSFSFVSATVDARLQLRGYLTDARDDGGNEYQANDFTFGTENGTGWRTVLVARETTPARMVITGVPITSTRLTRIALRPGIEIGDRNLGHHDLVFRNIAIAR